MVLGGDTRGIQDYIMPRCLSEVGPRNSSPSCIATSQGLTEEDNENPPFDLNQPEEPDTNTGDELEFSIENLEDDIPAEDDNSIEEDISKIAKIALSI